MFWFVAVSPAAVKLFISAIFTILGSAAKADSHCVCVCVPELHITQPYIYILVNFKFVPGNCYVNVGSGSFVHLRGATG